MRSFSALISSSLFSMEVCRSFSCVSNASAFCFSVFSRSIRLLLNSWSFLYFASISLISVVFFEFINCSCSFVMIKPRALSTASLSFALLTFVSTLSLRDSIEVTFSDDSYA